MSLLTQVQSGKRFAPRRLLLYDTYGIGKSTFGAQAPSLIFVQTEDGLGEIDGAKFPLALSYSDVLKALEALYTESHRYRTVGGDSLDWLERSIWAKICRQRPAGSVPRILTRNLQPNLASLYFHRIIRA